MESITNAYYANPVGWDIAIVLLVLLIAAVFPSRFEIKTHGWELLRPRGRKKMLRRARRNFIKMDFTQACVDFVEERVYNGHYTRQEASELYRDLKKSYPIKDLFPSPELLKANIKKRIASGVNTPVPLPGKEEKPKKAVTWISRTKKSTTA